MLRSQHGHLENVAAIVNSYNIDAKLGGSQSLMEFCFCKHQSSLRRSGVAVVYFHEVHVLCRLPFNHNIAYWL